MLKSNGAFRAVHFTEVVRISKDPGRFHCSRLVSISDLVAVTLTIINVISNQNEQVHVNLQDRDNLRTKDKSLYSCCQSVLFFGGSTIVRVHCIVGTFKNWRQYLRTDLKKAEH